MQLGSCPGERGRCSGLHNAAGQVSQDAAGSRQILNAKARDLAFIWSIYRKSWPSWDWWMRQPAGRKQSRCSEGPVSPWRPALDRWHQRVRPLGEAACH